MRLIDADKLENDIVENITVKAVSRMLAIIQGQPTVKAIPIEFIERKLAEHWYVDYDIRELLDDWEKENQSLE